MVDPIDDTVETPSEEIEDQSAVEEGQEVEFPQDGDEPIEETSLEDRVIHKLQSWQGRREKEQEDRLYGKIAELFIQQAQPPVQQPAYQPTVDDPEPDPDLDVKGWIRWDQRQQQMQQAVNQQFADQAYFGTINSPNVKHPDPATHEAAMKEIQHNQNIDPYTGQPMTPSADAVLNYNNALRKVMESRLAPPEKGQNPLASNQPPPSGLGVSQPAQQTRTAASMPRNLSTEAQKLINRSGWNAEKVRDVLKDE